MYQVLLINKMKKQTKKKIMLGNKIPDQKNHKGILNIIADVSIKWAKQNHKKNIQKYNNIAYKTLFLIKNNLD